VSTQDPTLSKCSKDLEGVAKPVAQQQPEDRQRVEIWVPEDLVDSLRAFLLGGVANQRGSVAKSVATQWLVDQTEELHKQGVSWREIARRWNAEGIPTLTGRDKWHDANIARLVRRK
jgi:hypothetical protein